MKNILFIIMTLSVLLTAPYNLKAEAEVSGTITMEFDLSAHSMKKPARLWIPYPVSDEHQMVTDIRWQGNYTNAAVYTDRKFQVPMLYVEWDKGSKTRKMKFSFKVNRLEVIKRNFPYRETLWDPKDYALYLQPSSLVPTNGAIKELAEKITLSKTSVLSKARAIYDWTCSNTYRNPETRGCGLGDVNEFLKNPGGKCADISSLFVALARATGVPCREVFGIRLGKMARQDISTWQHCWVEFYVPGYGWVPADPADVRKMMLKKNLDINDPETRKYVNYFFGGVDACRVKLSTGRDLNLYPSSKKIQINYLMYPFAIIGNDTLDWLDPGSFKYRIIYTH